jgi:excinuclease UvrABC nuclease subunit
VLVPLEASRDEASEKLEFEAAKQLHERVEKIKAIAREADELVRRIDQLDAVVVQPGVDKDAVTLFRFHECQLCGPISVSTGEAPIVPNRLEEALAQLGPTKRVSAAECSEHLAILKRWHHRSHKTGEIVFRNDDGSWPIRKLANACERVSKPSAPSHQPSERADSSLRSE